MGTELNTWPERIYLQPGEYAEVPNFHKADKGEIYFGFRKEFPCDVEYVRSDLWGGRAEPQASPTSDQNARHAIDATIEAGKAGAHKPPSDGHWLMPYWQIGQKLAKLEQPAIPAGYALVPVEPTDEMLWKAEEDSPPFYHGDPWYGSEPPSEKQVRAIYRAMLAAAPQPPEHNTISFTRQQLDDYRARIVAETVEKLAKQEPRELTDDVIERASWWVTSENLIGIKQWPNKRFAGLIADYVRGAK